ncbi:MAG: IniB N-terminal domain-containing protein [Actinomycetota bacterium]|nr:IniB N-terminal domain-containing protein [Actinomycetota bacterium]
MNVTQSLLDFILNLMRNDDAKTAFVTNPDKALADAGLSNVCSEDVSDAMSYVSEYHPVTFTGDREYNLGNGAHHDSDYYRPESNRGDDHRGDDYRPEGHHENSHVDAVRQLEYITNNYSYTDSHDTAIDKSINQNIWNKGDLSQRFDDNSVTATDHSVAAGNDINGNVANGNDNLVGDNNKVGNTETHDDHSISHSFNSTNVATNGGIAGNGNDGNATNPSNSNVATNGSEVDNSRHIDNSRTEIGSHNTEKVTDIENHDDSVHINNHPDNSVTDSYNGSGNEHSQIDQSQVHQHGLVNVDHVLSDDNLNLL